MVAFLRCMLVTWRPAEPSLMSSSLDELSVVLSQVRSLKPGMEQLALMLNGYGKLTLPPHDEVRQPGIWTGGAAVATRSCSASMAALAASSSSSDDDHGGIDGHCI